MYQKKKKNTTNGSFSQWKQTHFWIFLQNESKQQITIGLLLVNIKIGISFSNSYCENNPIENEKVYLIANALFFFHSKKVWDKNMNVQLYEFIIL